MKTFLHKFERNNASSTAVLPPPATATVLFLKKKPSHVAHAETPKPINSFSPSMLSHFAFAPVAITIEYEWNTSFSVSTTNGNLLKSTFLT